MKKIVSNKQKLLIFSTILINQFINELEYIEIIKISILELQGKVNSNLIG